MEQSTNELNNYEHQISIKQNLKISEPTNKIDKKENYKEILPYEVKIK
jgi:hypothetical protein